MKIKLKTSGIKREHIGPSKYEYIRNRYVINALGSYKGRECEMYLVIEEPATVGELDVKELEKLTIEISEP